MKEALIVIIVIAGIFNSLFIVGAMAAYKAAKDMNEALEEDDSLELYDEGIDKEL